MNKYCFAIVLFALTHYSQATEQHPLETVTVISSRSEQPLKNTTQSISIIDEKDLTAFNPQHPSQIFQHTPGTWISRGNGQEHLTAIRSPVFTGAGACGAFLMTEDGIPLRPSGFCNVNQLFDSHFEAANQIAVLRGPNSAVSGSNALFGSINVQLPSVVQAPEPTLKADVAGNDFYRARFSLPAANLLVLGTFTHDGGYRDNSGYQQGKFSLKHYTEGERLTAESGVSITSLNQETAGYIEGHNAYKDTQLSTTNPNPEAWRNSESLRAWSKLVWPLNDGTLSITPYARKTDMAFLMHFVPWQPVEENRTLSAGVQTQYSIQQSQAVEWSLGFDLESAKGSLTETQFQPAPFATTRFPEGAHYDYTVTANTGALFAKATVLFTPRWRGNINLRTDTIHYQYTNKLSTGSACEPAVENCRFYRPENRTDSFTTPSANAGLMFAFSRHHTAFLSIAEGFRAPQATELYRLQQGQNIAHLQAVSLRNMELGLRGGRSELYYQLALFNSQMAQGIFQDSARNNVSGAKTRHRGIEYELGYSFNPSFSARVAGSYAEHQYDNNPDLLGTRLAIRNNFIDTAPQHMHGATLDWAMHERFSARLEANYLGRYYLDPGNQYHYPGHTLANLRFHYQPFSSLSIGVHCLNILDKRYAERADVAFGEERYFPGQGRRWQLSAQLSI